MADPFTSTNPYYEALYLKPETFRAEVEQVFLWAERYQRSPGRALLNLACGTGGHLAYFRERFNCTGVDLSADMLEAARRKFPEMKFVQADMLDYSLGQTFDIITNLTGSIGFVRTRKNLYRALWNAARHLAPGGLLVLTPWTFREEFEEKIVSDLVKRQGLQISRMDHIRRTAPDRAEISMHHLVGQNGQVEYHTYTMEAGLFAQAEYEDAICRAGFEPLEIHRGSQFPMGAFVARRK